MANEARLTNFKGAESGNIRSHKLPGGNLIAAVLNRQLMSWSDRGGASRYFGMQWSEFCSMHLRNHIGELSTVPGGKPYTLKAVIRLDDEPRIAIQAGRHGLVNPDFVLFGIRDGTPILQSADAKFAVDTIKPPQVSAEALQALLGVEDGLVLHTIEAALGTLLDPEYEVERGVFISPDGAFTEHFLPKVIARQYAPVDLAEIIFLAADPVSLFGGLPMSQIVVPLTQQDNLPVHLNDSLLASMYYFRLACACAWMWVEERTPLFTLLPVPALDPVGLFKEVIRRKMAARSGFELVLDWSYHLERISNDRLTIKNAMSVPVSMARIRELVKRAGFEEDRRLIREVRGALEQRYRQRVFEQIGEIPAEPEEPLSVTVKEITLLNKKLAPELRRMVEDDVLDRIAKKASPDENPQRRD